MHYQNLNITGYSTALFSTWVFIEELGLLFDCGDGVMAGLLQKSRKVKHAFISHADRDHLMGLFQFNQLNARPKFLVIHYPADSGSFPFIADFVKKFDPHVSGTVWQPIRENKEYPIKTNLLVQTIRNGHIKAEGHLTKSLSFKVVATKQKLKKQFLGMSGKEIEKIRLKKGKDFITDRHEKTILGYSGDTPMESWDRWDNTETLIHEATFLRDEGGSVTAFAKNKHSRLDEVIEMAANIKVERLILSHFSSRYSAEEIDATIVELCQKFGIKIPVWRILPGEIVRNILQLPPVFG